MPLAFWLALGLLIANDHLLKGSGWLPALLTGKLSDVAGLIVAPLVLCRVLRVRTRAARALVFTAVAVPFIGIKVSEALAVAAGAWLSRLGLPTRVWCDPTDLVALLVLVWAWRLAEPRPAAARTQYASWAERAGIGMASLACIATSIDEPEQVVLRPPFVINWTRLPVELDIQLRTDLACAEVEEAGAMETVAKLPPARRLSLEPGQIAPIVAADLDASVAPASGCGAARISTEGGASVLVSWKAGVSDQAVPTSVTPDVPDGGTWYLSPENDSAFELAVTVIGAASNAELRIGKQLDAAGEP